jgi:hypothetical protein
MGLGEQCAVSKQVFKGTVPQDFLASGFFMNKFPPSTWEYHYGHFEFFRKSAEIFAAQNEPPPWHQWQMEKIFNQKNFNYFVWTPLGSRFNIYIHFCPQFHFKDSAAWYCFHILPPESTTLAKLVTKFAAGVVDTGGKFAGGVVHTGGNFAGGVVDTGGKFATGVIDTGGAPWLANISANFQKNLKWSWWDTQGLGGNLPMKKTRSKNLVILSL